MTPSKKVDLDISTWNDHVEDTYLGIKDHLNETPLLSSNKLNQLLGIQIFVKAENLQKTGSFKIRGALSSISRLSAEQLRNGVLAYSSGNHAQGVAMAAQIFNTSATIVMPSDAPKVKVLGTKAYSPNIIFYDRFNESREEIGKKIANERNLTIIKPYNSINTIFGQATAAFEVVNQIDIEIDSVLVCAGGGGLTAGFSIIMKKYYPKCEIYTAEPEHWNDHEQSFKNNKITPLKSIRPSICDGLLAMEPGEITFKINSAMGVQGLSCDDQHVIDAMKIAKEYFDQKLEPSGAVALGCLIKNRSLFSGKNVVITFSGGNVDDSEYSKLVNRSN